MADKCIALCPRLDRATRSNKKLRKASDDFMCIADAYKRGNKKGRCANVTAEVLNSAAKVTALNSGTIIGQKNAKLVAQAVSDHSYTAITKHCK